MSTRGDDEPSTAPEPDRWFPLTLGSSFKDHPQPSSKFCTLRYINPFFSLLLNVQTLSLFPFAIESNNNNDRIVPFCFVLNRSVCWWTDEFKPASIDKTQPGTLHKNKENRVTVEFQNNQPGKPKVTFEGSTEYYKEQDAVLFFDGQHFRLERLHRSFKRLRHIRLPGEPNAAAAAAAATSSATSVADTSSPPVAKGGAKVPNLVKTTFNPVPPLIDMTMKRPSEFLLPIQSCLLVHQMTNSTTWKNV